MNRFKFVFNGLAGLMLAGFVGQVATADEFGNKKDGDDIKQVRTFVDQASISIGDAIKKAEQTHNCKAFQAVAACEHAHGSGGVKTEHYRIACLTAANKVVEVCLDSRNGTVLASHETTTIPVAFRTTTTGGLAPNTSSLHVLHLERASELIGKNVENNRGERLGEVQDLAIDPDRARVVYAVLSFGGFLGMGEKWFAIPTGALNLSADGKHFILAVEKDRLKNAIGFEKDRWPKMGDTTWGTGIHEYYGQRPYWMEKDKTTPSAELRIVKASEIIGSNVQNDRGEKLGDIKDLVIDTNQGRIVYGVLSFGGFLGVGDKLFAIPTGALKLPGTGGFAVLSVDKDRLKNATGFEKSRWPNMADPVFVTTTYEFYGVRPYWVED